MGQSKGGGYIQKDTLTPGQTTAVNQALQQGGANQQAAAAGFNQFLPGGGGGQPIIDAAQQNFRQETIPNILNAFGSGSKGSSALNQALAAGGANLNTNLAAQLAQMQLQAAQGQGALGSQQVQVGTQTPQFAYLQRQQPFWQSALLGAISGGSQLGGAYLGAPK